MMNIMIEIFCVVMIGLNPVLASMLDAPVGLIGPEWILELDTQEFRDQVTQEFGQATLFNAPMEDFGTIGILAHSYLEGRRFVRLQEGNQLGLAWVDGRQMWYRVTEVRMYLATHPGFENSTLTRKGMILTEEEVYREVYGPPGRLVLQTCVGMSGGFLFVIAEQTTRLPAAGRTWGLEKIISVSGEVIYE